jgi:hypothetical protein
MFDGLEGLEVLLLLELRLHWRLYGLREWVLITEHVPGIVGEVGFSLDLVLLLPLIWSLHPGSPVTTTVVGPIKGLHIKIHEVEIQTVECKALLPMCSQAVQQPRRLCS